MASPIPKNPRKGVSRQRRWQIKMKESGRCIICGKPREHYAQHCDECWRSITNRKPWQPGYPGRPPKSAVRLAFPNKSGQMIIL